MAKSGLPRLRGDGPTEKACALLATVAPPPARGWTPHLRGKTPPNMGSPACAGMDPVRCVHVGKCDRLPRLRGDGPQTAFMLARGVVAPPPARGWTRLWRPDLAWREGSPACAGMDPGTGSLRVTLRWLPRLRGDGPRASEMRVAKIMAPPPARGWTPHRRTGPPSWRGSPACAGMDPDPKRQGFFHRWLPRLRGDGPLQGAGNSLMASAPPPARGWTRLGSRRATRVEGSPACAGMDPGR